MKKILLLAFVSMALLGVVSCSGDDKDSTPIPSLVGTSWQCVHTFTIPVVNTSATLQADLDFTTDNQCHAELSLPASLSSLLPMDLNGDYEYRFDGQKVVVVTGNSTIGDIEMDYGNGTMLIFTVPQNYRTILGTSELIFHKK